MSEVEDFLSPDHPPGNRGIARIGEAFSEIARHISSEGVLGIVVIDASALADVERSFGGDAFRKAITSLHDVVEGLIGDRLGVNDLILGGESGQNEIVVVLFRGPCDVEFYTRELPELHQTVVVGLDKRNHRIGYPYLTKPLHLPVGIGASLRNPTISAETQFAGALAEARRDAELNERNSARKRRRSLIELILEGRVRSVYEPIVDVSTRTVFGYEALARGPEDTELHTPIALFNSAAEEGLLFQLDCLCRKSGLDGARDFPNGAKLFLNVRPTTIHDPNFRADTLRRTLDHCGLAPTDVVLEVSEQESISNFEIFREVRDYYRSMGFQIALDDVGAGYASLEGVLELSPDFIKVDRAFVANIDEDTARQELLRALLLIADKIGARIIGEGLDTLEELETLRRLGIPFGQGWLFGKPHPLRVDT